MKRNTSITQSVGESLARLLSDKIRTVYADFPAEDYIDAVSQQSEDLTYTQRVELHADLIYGFLPKDFNKALGIFLDIMGEENKNETGMFTHYYWMLPIGKYIEKYGLQNFELSIHAIEEITKRGTGEYAIRPYIRRFPQQTLAVMTRWAMSDNFHLRRLASEVLRPKLPWATKLYTFTGEPEKVFSILELLKEDTVMFVKKSVANHLTDWLKVNEAPARELLRKWGESENPHTRWIIKRATRKTG